MASSSSEPNGWFIAGFMLDKALVAQGTARNDAAKGIDTADRLDDSDDAVKNVPAKETPAAAEPELFPVETKAITGQKATETTKK